MKKLILILTFLLPLYLFGQIGNISNGESGLSVRGKLNQTIDTVNKYNDDFPYIDSNKINIASASALSDAIEADTDIDSINIGGYVLRFNQSEGVHEFVTAYGDVVWQGPLEDLEIGYNNTGGEITNGTPCYLGGPNGDTIPTLGIAYASIEFTALRFIGLATMDIPDGTVGVVARRGQVRDMNTSLLSTTGVVYLGEGVLTITKPAYPSQVVVSGGALNIGTTDGIMLVDVSLALQRQLKTKSYSFTSLSISTGEYWKAGFYDASTTSITLTQASLTQTYGTADVAYEAHPFAVCGGVGTVTGGGRVSLISIGTSYDDATGAQTPADPDTLITDITTVSLDDYFETKKYLGTVTYQLVIVEGAPSAYSLTFNYGYAKYDDINDRDFYISGIECVWLGDGADATGFDVELYKHSPSGWTYAATGFEPGDGVLVQRSVDQAGFLRVASGVESAWKRSSLNEFIDGNGTEGFLIKVSQGAPSTIQTMDIHVEVAID